MQCTLDSFSFVSVCFPVCTHSPESQPLFRNSLVEQEPSAIDIAVLADRGLVLIACHRGTLVVWDVKSGTSFCLLELEGGNPVTSVAVLGRPRPGAGPVDGRCVAEQSEANASSSSRSSAVVVTSTAGDCFILSAVDLEERVQAARQQRSGAME